jgi:transposase
MIRIFSKYQYVKAVTSKGVTYSDEFKQIFITELNKEKLPREIFEEFEFNRVFEVDITIIFLLPH